MYRARKFFVIKVKRRKGHTQRYTHLLSPNLLPRMTWTLSRDTHSTRRGTVARQRPSFNQHTHTQTHWKTEASIAEYSLSYLVWMLQDDDSCLNRDWRLGETATDTHYTRSPAHVVAIHSRCNVDVRSGILTYTSGRCLSSLTARREEHRAPGMDQPFHYY